MDFASALMQTDHNEPVPPAIESFRKHHSVLADWAARGVFFALSGLPSGHDGAAV